MKRFISISLAMTLLLSNLVYADDIVSDTTIESMETAPDAEDADSVTGEAIEDIIETHSRSWS